MLSQLTGHFFCFCFLQPSQISGYAAAVCGHPWWSRYSLEMSDTLRIPRWKTYFTHHRLQARVLRLPTVERLLADLSLPDHLGHRNTHLHLLQHSNYLLHRKTLLLHPKPPPYPGQIWSKTKISSGSEMPRPITRPTSPARRVTGRRRQKSRRRGAAGAYPGGVCGEPGSLRLAVHLAACSPRALAWESSAFSDQKKSLGYLYENRLAITASG